MKKNTEKDTPETTVEKQLKNLGKRITALRKKKGFTNYEFFAYENKIGRSQYGRYERGTDMQFSSIVKLIEMHGITLKEFFSEGFDIKEKP
jgi:transcriptional regulator with XRE-family HTH domain